MIDITTIIPGLVEHIEFRICVLGRRVNVFIRCIHIYAVSLKRTGQIGRLASGCVWCRDAGRMESGDAL